MNKIIRILFSLLSFFSLAFFIQPFPQTHCNWNLTFSDDFNGQALDRTRWSSQYSSGGGGERQYYGPNSFKLKDGLLNIYASPTPSHGYPYTSGIITTQNLFEQQYGRFVIRAKLPSGKGFWPAFWLLPSTRNFPVEIDVFEMLGHDPQTIYMSNHWKGANGSHQYQTARISGDTDFSAEFHTYEIVWNPEGIEWFIDGVSQHGSFQGIPSEPMFLLINLAVGGNWPGNPNESTLFPGVMQIDYVRVYQKACKGTTMEIQN